MPIFGVDVPFPEFCGIEEVGVFDGATRLRVTVRPHHINNVGIVHGGLICTLLDVALATPARIGLGYPVITLDMQVAFVGAGRGDLVGEGRLVRAGRSISYTEAEVRHEADGTLVAKGMSVVKAARQG